MKIVRGMIGVLLFVFGNVVVAQTLSKEAAVALAEKFVADDGYTNLPPQQLKSSLNQEMFDSAFTHDQVIRMRFNSLRPRAIGAKAFIAFDYV